ncbi:Gfo/Idh/MocA family protein [Neorhodopirellula pilleata]|uniref:Inositol 2-dehydrogenase n=1 Tax=Neorhodopirellula pilleata TaxID=2714738 RepID=A0A5C5ZQ10_9BACT|nr:Gfo/Idh/MocA family oxidoreductase [Neorhodopirellula pilleata]TWT89559.1 Inositol 2-dehydrogenase [Neorhodopirellula pilleata]
MTIARRQFLQSTAGALTAGALIAGSPAVHAQSKTKRYRTALIGSGWWGMNILKEAMAAGNTKVVALCDVDQDKLELGAEEVEDLSGDSPKTFTDFRELLDKQEIDIAIVATPDHWHALNTIAAIEKGAHIFVEKPTGHTIHESRAMLNAARLNDRVVQVGLHRRIGPHYVSGMKFLKDGGAGDIGMVRMFVHSRGGEERPTPNSEPPEQLDWDMYCGPAPMRPFNRKIHPGGFRNFLDFANGTLGDWGVHWLDQVLWWTDEKYPKQIYSTGGRPVSGEPVLNEMMQTTDAPDSQIATYQFESFTATWEHRKFAGSRPGQPSVGCYFYGTEGTFHMGWRDGWSFFPADSRKQVIHEKSQHKEPDGHSIDLLWADFTNAIESKSRPTCDVQIGHDATNMSLLGMLSYKLGRSIEWDGEKEQIVGDAEANAMLKRPYRGPWVYPDA